MSNAVEGFMPWWVADYFRDTMHLTRDQHGGYMMLLGAYWTRGGPLPDNDAMLAAIVKATPAEWKKLRPVLSGFFIVGDGVWRQKRAEEEIAKALAQKEAARARTAAATAAKLARKGNVTTGVTTVLTTTPPPSPPPLTTPPPSGDDAARDAQRAAVCRALGLPLEPQSWEPPWFGLNASLETWLADGCDWNRHILAGCADMRRKPENMSKGVRYLNAIVMRLKASTPAAAAPVAGGPDPRAPASDTKARARLEAWAKGQWPRDQWGPTPDEPGCLIPAHILAERKAA